MREPYRNRADDRVFWVVLLACSAPPLAGGVAIVAGWDGALDVLIAAWMAVYALSFCWMLVSAFTRRSDRALPIFLAMVAALLIGPGSCLTLVLVAA